MTHEPSIVVYYTKFEFRLYVIILKKMISMEDEQSVFRNVIDIVI
jgi:hypothetical protein